MKVSGALSVIAALCFLSLLGCKDAPAPERREQSSPAEPATQPDAPDAPAEQAQGIHARAVRVAGAFDDPMGLETESQPSTAPVHVFRGRVQPFERPNPDHPALIKVVTPDARGRFDLPLPPGEYTLVFELDGKLYLNNWLSDGSWATATVRPGQWTDYVIENVLELEPEE